MFLFSAMKSIQGDVQDRINSRVGNHIVFAVIYSTEKITDFIFRNGNVFFVFVLVIVSINQCITLQATFGLI